MAPPAEPAARPKTAAPPPKFAAPPPKFDTAGAVPKRPDTAISSGARPADGSQRLCGCRSTIVAHVAFGCVHTPCEQVEGNAASCISISCCLDCFYCLTAVCRRLIAQHAFLLYPHHLRRCQGAGHCCRRSSDCARCAGSARRPHCPGRRKRSCAAAGTTASRCAASSSRGRGSRGGSGRRRRGAAAAGRSSHLRAAGLGGRTRGH